MKSSKSPIYSFAVARKGMGEEPWMMLNMDEFQMIGCIGQVHKRARIVIRQANGPDVFVDNLNTHMRMKFRVNGVEIKPPKWEPIPKLTKEERVKFDLSREVHD